ncbi:RasGEF domain protein [Onchocerca flexuosa]|uniref:RasGEF domain protein n=1 Tax=Onchocerca flexuosa TaxID=387005 RepID=A0A238C275_9BILA|nr:RasGEF domain protein [Onchocerca flexuosa]
MLISTTSDNLSSGNLKAKENDQEKANKQEPIFKQDPLTGNPSIPHPAFDDQDRVFDDTGSLVSVTLDSLIELLIPSRNYSPEQSYIFAALLNIRIFISPPDLLQKILQLDRAERFERALIYISSCMDQVLNTHDNNYKRLVEICPNPTTLAQQMTLIELERLSMIGPDEIVYAAIDVDDAKKRFGNRMNNIRNYIDWSNRLTYLTATEILRCSKRQYRIFAIEYFIDVAKECINIGNFNSFMAIVAALSLPLIARLKKTWNRVEKSKLDILRHQFDPTANFVSYRSTLKAAIWRFNRAKNETDAIIIPFFGLLIKDLSLLHRQCAQLLPNGHINFKMFSQFGNEVSNFIKWKNRKCLFERDTRTLHQLLLSRTLSEKQLIKLSYNCEIAEQTSEKELYRRLKNDGNVQ